MGFPAKKSTVAASGDLPDRRSRHSCVQPLEAERTLKRLISSAHDDGFNLPETDSRVIAAQKRLAKAVDDQRLNERSETRSQAWRTASGALAACEAWLRDGKPHGTVLELLEGPEPKLNKGESITDAIERHRRRVRELRADLHRIESAPYPSKHAKARLREAIEILAQRGTPDVSALIEHDGNIVWPMQRVQSQVFNAGPGAVAFHEVVDVVGLFAFFLKPTAISILDGLVDIEGDDKAALSHEAREKAEAETMADLLAVERDECVPVWQAQAQGLPVEHRADISPLALLGLKLVTTARAVPSFGSSPEHAWNLVGR